MNTIMNERTDTIVKSTIHIKTAMIAIFCTYVKEKVHDEIISQNL